MKKFRLLVTTFLVINSLFAQIPDGYYDDATGTGYSLKTQLYNIIDGHTSRSYTNLWTDMQSTDKKANGYVWDMYSDIPGGSPAYDYTFGSDQCGSYGSEGDCYNREHSFPKSWFNEGTPMYTDLFHLYPTDGKVNGQRSNYPFGEVGTVSWTSTNGSKLGTCNYPGYTGTVFEPIDEYKGDFARTYFYMATRYENIISGWESNTTYSDAVLDGSSDHVYEDWYLNLIIEWHKNDPVSQKEIDRNNAVYAIQHNRNPFIDHPEYVCQIWGGDCGSTAPSISDIIISPTNPKSTETVSVSATITDDGTIASAKLYWGTNSGSLTNTITMSVSTGNIYATTADIPAQADGISVYYEIEATDDEAEVSTSAEKSYTVEDNPPVEILNEDFTTCPATGWILYDVSGSENWECGTDFMQVNAYGSDVACDDWLISPALDLNSYENEILTFKSWTKYTDTYHPIALKYSTNYSGSGDHSSATWNTVPGSYTWSTENSEAWISSGDIDISGIIGTQVYFAFQYTSSGTGSASSSQWEIDDVLILGNESTNSLPSITSILNSPTNPTEDEDVTVSATITDDGTILSAILKWGISTGIYPNDLTMTNVGSSYSAVIPKQTGGTIIYYVIEATDNLSKSTITSENDFSFTTVGNVLPQITNVNYLPTDPESTESVTVSATISDSDGTISSAKIKWGTSTGNYSNELTMLVSKGNYSGSIPVQVDGSEVYFVVYALDNEGGSTQSSEENYTVNDPNVLPQITNVDHSPTNPESSESVTVSATISDSDGTISSAKIKWGTSTGSYSNELTMIASKGNYSGIIPVQVDGIHVYFVVYALVNDGGSTQSLEENYTVSDPNVLPQITNITHTPTGPTDQEDVTVSATITDDGSIQSAKLSWGTASGNLTNILNMSNSGDVFSVVIPMQTGGSTVFYSIRATDNNSESSTSAEMSYNVSISEGIETINAENLNIYPNPTNNKIYVELNNDLLIKSIMVYNLIGEKILEFDQVNTTKYTVNLAAFSKGFYIIQVNGVESTAARKVMLK